MLFLKEDKRMSHEIKRLQGGGVETLISSSYV